MNRRNLIKAMATGFPAWYIAPWVLAACSKKDDEDASNFKGSVCIVGAGAAGIYAAAFLMARGIDVTILEASAIAGGRIRSAQGFADFPIELGAEEIHGRRSLLYDLALAFAPNAVLPEPGTSKYWLNGALRDEYYFTESSALQGAGAILLQITESFASYEGPDISLQEYLLNFPVDESLLDIANALIANEYGTQLDRIGMHALREAEQLYSSGIDGYFLKNQSLWSLFEKAFPEAMAKIQFNQNVTEINYAGDNVIVKTSNGLEYTSKKILLTVPISILQQDLIAFSPDIPPQKQTAINAIKMDSGSKFVLRFSAPFWTEDTGSILGGTKIPEYWVASSGKNSTTPILTAFVMGERASYFQGMNETQIQTELLAELSLVYPTENPTALCTGIAIQRWADEPFIRGAYSYPSPESTGMREVLAEPLANKLYFAGEACNVNGHIATVHGAMESAYLACKSIVS
jgi:monoamine oxidase